MLRTRTVDILCNRTSDKSHEGDEGLGEVHWEIRVYFVVRFSSATHLLYLQESGVESPSRERRSWLTLRTFTSSPCRARARIRSVESGEL
jgi:hypothetical protein